MNVPLTIVHVQSPYVSQIFYCVDLGAASQEFWTQLDFVPQEMIVLQSTLHLPHIFHLCRLTHIKCATHNLRQIKMTTFTKYEPNFPEFTI